MLPFRMPLPLGYNRRVFTNAALLDLHALTHSGTAKLLDHCSKLSADDLHRELAGFGLSTVQRTLHHIVEAEHYWVDILEDRFKDYDKAVIEADIAWKDYLALADIEEYRKRVADVTVDYLQAATDKSLNTPAGFQTWPPDKITLIPARVIIRTLTHAFHHRGQVAAMCRLLGCPTPPLDYPVVPDEPAD